MTRVYVASSWRNPRYEGVIERLRAEDIPHYDFKQPRPGIGGFAWTDVWKDIAADGQGANDWQKAKGEQVVEMLKHPIAVYGFHHEYSALLDSWACLLVMPCGRSAHLEMGYAIGSRKPSVVLLDTESEAELMWKMADLVTVSLDEAVEFLKR
ncbi:MAG TPA: hypothetical protein VGR85_15600 [Candidatus Limnocylindria bacterium]|jgi:hypothetical protein|nr:hypothetical protein [Candidatus Limnocylindria bacterium]